MLQRLALLLGCVTVAGVIAIALSLNGFAPAVSPDAIEPSTPAVAVEPAAVAAATSAPAATALTQVDTVYVKPAAKPKVVKVVRHAPAATAPPVQRVVVVASTSHEGDDGEGKSDDESEGESD
jgi:hypothetical protein